MIMIDNRFLVPVVTPVALVLIARAVFFVAGAEWTDDVAHIFAGSLAVLGTLGGYILMIVLFNQRIEIGKIRIGRRKP